MRQALKTKQVDAVTTDNVILLGYVNQDPGALKILNKAFTQEPYGMASARTTRRSAPSSTTYW